MKNKFKKLFKKMKDNKLITMLIILLILFMILGIVAIKVLIFPNYKVDKYGDRLNGMENVLIDDSRFNEVIGSVEVLEGLEIKNTKLTGKIVNIFINVSGDISISEVKDFSNKLVLSFNENELKYYDFQVFLTGEGDNYPSIGYKNKKSAELFWNIEGGNNEE